MKGHTRAVYSVAFFFSSDESVRVWDASTAAELNVDEFVAGQSPDYRPRAICLESERDKLQWIVSSQGKDHLMWVPPAAQVTEPSNNIVISRHGFGSVDFQQYMIGVERVACYTS